MAGISTADTSGLCGQGFSLEQTKNLAEVIDLSERVDAFVSRFGRLQDTVGDKQLPLLLHIMGESTGAVIDNLSRAERFSWLDAGHGFVAELTAIANRLISESQRRGFHPSEA